MEVVAEAMYWPCSRGSRTPLLKAALPSQGTLFPGFAAEELEWKGV